MRVSEIDILKVLTMFKLTKCQNEKCRQQTQNRVADGTFLDLFRDKHRIYDVKAYLPYCNMIALTL